MQTETMAVAGIPCRVSRLGYTGEDGFEISVPADHAAKLAERLLEHPAAAPAGLGARDSLRLEAGLCLYGHELDEATSPIEAGLDWIVQKARRAEGGFPGAKRILAELQAGPARRLVGIRPDDRAPARDGTEIRTPDGAPLGLVTSGSFGPTVDGPVSLGYVEAAYGAPGRPVELLVRGRARAGRIVALPFTPHRYQR
jgi:aminomethyltransferase